MHLISYVSTSLVPACQVETELAAITKTAADKNAHAGITGVLFCQGNHFFQMIEGPQARLEQLYKTLEQDPRHTNLAKLIDQPVPERQFGDWSMYAFHVDDPDIINPRTLSLIQELYLHNFGADAPDLIEFARRMIDEMDTFRIERPQATRLH